MQRKILFFLEEKNILPAGELNLTPSMKLLIAAQACLLIVNLDQRSFTGLKTIFVMADTFIAKDNFVSPATGRPRHSPLLGEARRFGPIVLSWRAVKDGLKNHGDGQNVVYHEFSHHLDQEDGIFDGIPSLDASSGTSYRQWVQVLGKEFRELRTKVEHHHASDIDSYGAENSAEFFAVLTEYFLERPEELHRRHPEIYLLFQGFFKLDPLKWNL